jgi:hypothetical protein
MLSRVNSVSTALAVLPELKLRKFPDLLIKVKPRLDDNTPGVRVALAQDLHRIAFLAESLTEQRSRSKKSLVHVEELLDREGSLFCYHFRDITFESPLQAFSCGILPESLARHLMMMVALSSLHVSSLWVFRIFPKSRSQPQFPSRGKVRLAAFRLIEAGLEQKPSIECLGSPTAAFLV